MYFVKLLILCVVLLVLVECGAARRHSVARHAKHKRHSVKVREGWAAVRERKSPLLFGLKPQSLTDFELDKKVFDKI